MANALYGGLDPSDGRLAIDPRGGRLGLCPCQGVISHSPVTPPGRIEPSSYERLVLRLQSPPLVRLEQAIASEVAVAEATKPGA